jgi:hypothetical protein
VIEESVSAPAVAQRQRRRRHRMEQRILLVFIKETPFLIAD